MTAPLRSGEPITVNVALGDRAYDIVIGRGLMAHARRADRQRCGRAQGRHRHRRERGAPSSARGGSRARARRHRRAPRQRAARREHQELSRSSRASARRCSARADRARRSRRGARRRRGRRSRRLCRLGGAPRRRLRAGADHAAGAGRFLGRRQDRDQFAPGQEPGRRVPSADPGGGRHGAARHPAGARIPRRLRRSGQIRPARRRALSSTGSMPTGATCSPAGRRASTPSR